jgi:hypothetical protein
MSWERPAAELRAARFISCRTIAGAPVFIGSVRKLTVYLLRAVGGVSLAARK